MSAGTEFHAVGFIAENPYWPSFVFV